MKKPKHPVRPAFDKSSDAMEAWRQQQQAALTPTQRQLHDSARHLSEEREKAKANELAERRQPEIKALKDKKMLESPAPELKPREKRGNIQAMSERQAGRAAAAAIAQVHESEREEMARTERQTLDDQLRQFETARNDPSESREAFGRAIMEERAKTDFEKARSPLEQTGTATDRAIAGVREKGPLRDAFRDAARDDGSRTAPVRSSAIDKAISDAREKQEDQRDRATNEMDRNL